MELIETLWNVNLKNCVNFFGRLRINRNIVECKFERQKEEIERLRELIETLWNVNDYGKNHAPVNGIPN